MSDLSILRDPSPSTARTVSAVIRLSIPAILAEITSVAMQYIDSAMVGTLGEGASAAIGLISSTTWLLGGLCVAIATGFSVQIAQYVGAGREDLARNVFRQSLLVTGIFGLIMGAIALGMSGPLPALLGGEISIRADASAYLAVYALSLPLIQLRQNAAAALQCTGDMKTPGMLHILLCLLNVIFNLILIFPTRSLPLGPVTLVLPGAGLGVVGAALGSALSEALIALAMLARACLGSDKLALSLGGSFRLRADCLTAAARISLPAALEHTVMCSAYVTATGITAPLGKTDLAANALAVTAESFCYMPGYGIGAASLTLVGQALGAGRKDLAKRLGRCSLLLGIITMSLSAVAMYLLAPWMMALLTPVPAVRESGAAMLRLVAFAEPFYAISIVCADVLRGGGDTAVPGLINLISMWGVRISLSLLLVRPFGLAGIWYAMCADLVVRGLLFLCRFLSGKWLNRRVISV